MTCSFLKQYHDFLCSFDLLLCTFLAAFSFYFFFFFPPKCAVVFQSLRKLDMDVLILFFLFNNYALPSLFSLSSHSSVIHVRHHKNDPCNY